MDEDFTQIDDRYEVLERLGHGGMGKVYRCHDRELKREVAVKVLYEDSAESSIQRFHVEAKAAAQLAHENIISVLDFGTTPDDQFYMVMELLSGQSLVDLVIQEETLEPMYALELSRQICLGLQHAHDKGVLHRDVKSSNVMVVRDHNDDLKVKVVDFGIAKLVGKDQSLTRSGNCVGTPSYMSPEAVEGKEQDRRSDIYSFGCLMFELFTGCRPFQGNNPLATMLLHKRAPAPPLKDYSDEPFAEEIEKIVAKCLAKDPSQRYQSFNEIVSAIDSYLESLEPEPVVEEDPVPLPQIMQKQSESPRYTKAVMLGLAATILLPTVFYFLSSTRFEKVPDHKRNEEIDRMFSLTPESIDKTVESAAIRPFKRSTGIVVKGTKLTSDEHIEPASKIHKTHKRWDLQLSSINGEGLRHLVPLPIETLILYDSTIKRVALTHISKMEHLKQLNIFNCHGLKGNDIALLADLTTLEDLRVSGKNINASVCRQIASIKSLKEVWLRTVMRKDDFKPLLKLDKLSKFRLEYTTVDRSTCEGLATLPHLRDLWLRRVEIDPDAFTPLSKSHTLKVIDIIDPRIKSAKDLISLRNLKNLNISIELSQKTSNFAQELREKLPRNCKVSLAKPE